jgi:SAM-dependent methyltransferase
MRNYERLSQVYDYGWYKFPKQYLDLVERLLDEHDIRQARVLDIACGTGILAISLAKRGHVVQGIDISPEMITMARSKSIGMPNVSFEVQDMTDYIVHDKFDLITCAYAALNYVLDIDGLEAMFARVALSLNKSGLFVFDCNCNQHYINQGDGSYKIAIGQQYIFIRWSHDPVTRERTTIFKFTDGSEEIHRQQPYDLSEIGPVLKGSNLCPIHTWSGFDRSPYNDQSTWLFCVAKKDV